LPLFGDFGIELRRIDLDAVLVKDVAMDLAVACVNLGTGCRRPSMTATCSRLNRTMRDAHAVLFGTRFYIRQSAQRVRHGAISKAGAAR